MRTSKRGSLQICVPARIHEHCREGFSAHLLPIAPNWLRTATKHQQRQFSKLAQRDDQHSKRRYDQNAQGESADRQPVLSPVQT